MPAAAKYAVHSGDAAEPLPERGEFTLLDRDDAVAIQRFDLGMFVHDGAPGRRRLPRYCNTNPGVTGATSIDDAAEHGDVAEHGPALPK